jgi:hypothetical protein
MSSPDTPVVVPAAGLPPLPGLPPELNPETPLVEPPDGRFPEGTLAEAAGTVGAGAGVDDVVGAGGVGGGGCAGAGAVAIVRAAATAKGANAAADAIVVVLMVSLVSSGVSSLSMGLRMLVCVLPHSILVANSPCTK